MKKLALALSIAVLPATAGASIHDVRTGPGARVGSTSTSAGLVLERASFEVDKKQSSLAAFADVQMPVGPVAARIRVPLQLSGPDDTDTGLGNASVGAAVGMELGLGVKAALTAGLDLLVPTQGKDAMANHSLRSGQHFARKLMSANPYAVVTLATPVVETRLDVDVIYGISQEDNDDLDSKMMTVGLTGELSVMPTVGLLVGLDHFRDLSENAQDPWTYGRAGVHAGLAMLDVSVEANFVVAAEDSVKDNAGLGLVASVSAGF